MKFFVDFFLIWEISIIKSVVYEWPEIVFHNFKFRMSDSKKCIFMKENHLLTAVFYFIEKVASKISVLLPNRPVSGFPEIKPQLALK